MGLMNFFGARMAKGLSVEKREEMMAKMMPQMMDGVDINQLMPKMMKQLLQNVTSDDLLTYIKRTLANFDGIIHFLNKMKSAIPSMMIKRYQSKLDFEATVAAISKAAPDNGWKILDTRRLDKDYHDAGLPEMKPVQILYFCNAPGGYRILHDDENYALSVMMPMGVSITETAAGHTEISAMNIAMMSHLFDGATKEVLKTSADNLDKTLRNVVQ